MKLGCGGDDPTPESVEPEVIGGRWTEDRCLVDRTPLDGQVDYRITTHLIAEAVLCVEAGVLIEVEPSVHVYVGSMGGLEIRGTEAAPVIFRGRSGSNWGPLALASEGFPNVIDGLVVEDAGAALGSRGIFEPTGVAFGSEAGASARMARVNGLRIGRGEGPGLWIHGATLEGPIENLVITDRSAEPLRTFPRYLADLDPASIQLSGNARDQVGLGTERVSGKPIVFHDVGIPYFMSEVFGGTGLLEAQSGLRIEPGVELQLGAEVSIAVTGDGALSAEGTAASPILVRNRPGAGPFGGIFILTEADNRIAFTEIDGGGGAALGSRGAFEAANIVVGSAVNTGGKLALEDAAIRNSADFGVFVYQNGAVDEQRTRYEGNASGDLVFED